MGDLNSIDSPGTKPATSRPMPVREDCWSEDATSTLVDAWGRRYLELNRGNLRQNDWQKVADAVNAVHGHNKKSIRTDVQCKNRVDTLKKKYKSEKARVSDTNGSESETPASSWPFFARLDSLIGSVPAVKKPTRSATAVKKPYPSPSTIRSGSLAIKKLSSSPPMALPLPNRKSTPTSSDRIVLPQKRHLLRAVDDSYFRRNYSAVAAAAAAVQEDGSEDDDELEDLASSEEISGDTKEDASESMRRLAKAIESFGEIYQKVEAEKQKQMIELEKQKMQFAKDLEVQRMQLFMDTQVQLEKMKQAKSAGSDEFFG